MLRARIVTAVVLLCAFLSALFLLPRPWFAALVGVVVAVAAHEWAGLCRLAGVARWGFVGMATAAYAATAAWLLSGGALDPLHGAATAFWAIAAPWWMARGVTAAAKGWLVPVGFLVVVPAAAAMVQLEPRMLLVALALPWVADTVAYFVGRAFGRRKLAPSISPGKTLEGAAGGLAGVAIYAMICGTLLPELRRAIEGPGWAALLGAALVLGVLSIVGDLFESAVKRQAGAKDSGTLLPGHGGVLDRIDSATSTLPLAALMFGMIRP